MADALRQDNLNDEKITLVQKLLQKGKTRFEVARAVGYQGVDGLDRYAKRAGFVWNATNKNYELKGIPRASSIENPSERIMTILSMVDDGTELNTIAKHFRMKNLQELAEYMKNKGYVWDIEKGNYVKESFVIADAETEVDSNEEDNDFDIMKFLESNKDRLLELLSSNTSKVIPRYMIKGIMITKSFYISNEIDRLLKDFGSRKGIPQKDIIQTALIEYFQRYGYNEEAGVLIKP